jgi:hypothetical protein
MAQNVIIGRWRDEQLCGQCAATLFGIGFNERFHRTNFGLRDTAVESFLLSLYYARLY